MGVIGIGRSSLCGCPTNSPNEREMADELGDYCILHPSKLLPSAEQQSVSALPVICSLDLLPPVPQMYTSTSSVRPD